MAKKEEAASLKGPELEAGPADHSSPQYYLKEVLWSRLRVVECHSRSEASTENQPAVNTECGTQRRHVSCKRSKRPANTSCS